MLVSSTRLGLNSQDIPQFIEILKQNNIAASHQIGDKIIYKGGRNHARGAVSIVELAFEDLPQALTLAQQFKDEVHVVS